jgi:hypothetical protein
MKIQKNKAMLNLLLVTYLSLLLVGCTIWKEPLYGWNPVSAADIAPLDGIWRDPDDTSSPIMIINTNEMRMTIVYQLDKWLSTEYVDFKATKHKDKIFFNMSNNSIRHDVFERKTVRLDFPKVGYRVYIMKILNQDHLAMYELNEKEIQSVIQNPKVQLTSIKPKMFRGISGFWDLIDMSKLSRAELEAIDIDEGSLETTLHRLKPVQP